MAAKGGPLILLGGLAALLMLKKKGSGGDTYVPEEEPLPEEGEEAHESGGSSGGTGKAYGNPPNNSGDSAGYNTDMFKGPAGVRQWFVNLGYSLPINTNPVIKQASVKSFQRDYNKYSNKVAAQGDHSLGRLSVDGTAGKNTLNAVEIAHFLSVHHKKSWHNLVG